MAGEEASIRLERGLRQSNNDNDNDNDDDNDNYRSPSVYFDPRRHRYVRIPRQQGQDGYGEAGET